MLLLLNPFEASMSVRRIWLLTPLGNSSGVKKIMLTAGKGPESKTNLIDGLLIKKCVSDSEKQAIYSGESDIALRQGCLLPIAVQDGMKNELPMMAA